MGLVVFFLFAGLLAAFFACGVYVGCALSSHAHPRLSIRLPSDSVGLNNAIEDLQGIIRRVEKQLLKHGRRIGDDAARLRNACETVLRARIIDGMIHSSEHFEKSLRHAAHDIRAAEQRLTQSEAASLQSAQRDAADGEETPGSALIPTQQHDQRSETRHPFFCKQWIAPYNGCRAPEPEEFFCVQCRDISSGGISFFLDRDPKFQLVVVRLCGAEGAKYLTARIQRVTPIGNSEHGQYTVGCQFLGTLHPSTLPPHLDASIHRAEARQSPQDEFAITSACGARA